MKRSIKKDKTWSKKLLSVFSGSDDRGLSYFSPGSDLVVDNEISDEEMEKIKWLIANKPNETTHIALSGGDSGNSYLKACLAGFKYWHRDREAWIERLDIEYENICSIENLRLIIKMNEKIKQMRNRNYERAKSILRDSPEGATHYCVLQYDCIEVYWKIEDACIHTLNEDGSEWVFRENIEANGFYIIESLDNLQTIVDVFEEKERLRKQLKNTDS